MVAVAAAGGAADFALVEIADRQKHPRAFGAGANRDVERDHRPDVGRCRAPMSGE
jgi:hypothetical protein